MSLFYGFAGAHRVGKSTLAREVAAELEVPFYETSLSETLRSMAIDPQADLPFSTRLDVQDAILTTLMAGYAKARTEHPDESIIIVDRTPLDVLAYTTAEILRETIDGPAVEQKMARHERICYEATNMNFAGICLVSPGIPLVADRSKAPANPYYQRHVHAAMLEAVVNPRNKVNTLMMHRGNVQLNSRVTDTIEHLEAILSRIDNKLAAQVAQGRLH